MPTEGTEEIAVAGTGFEDAAGGTKVGDEPTRQLRGSLDIVVAGVITVGLEAHDGPRNTRRTRKRSD